MLTIEWRNRVNCWRDELREHFYIPLAPVPVAGFTTFDQLTPERALEEEFQLMPVGTPWGAKWEYGWFRGQVTTPAEAAGKRLALRLDLGGESVVYVNGVASGAIDRQHREITLARDARPGATYDVLVEAYAGHGPMVCHAGPTPTGRETVPEPPAAQAVVGQSTYGLWEEEVYQLWLDVNSLWVLRDKLDENSLRLVEIDRALRDFTVLVDFEADHAALMSGVRAARERLKPLLEAVNGSTAPTLFTIGHSHIDVCWLWPLDETERKVVRTFGTQLALMDEYPEYKFLQSQTHLYRMAKELYPEVYARIKEAAKRGQWVAEGGMWVEADTNLSGGESLIRQFVHGKRFFQDEFGVDSKVLWLPDVFGYSGAMPQIMRGCGIEYFATAKIFWNYNGGDPFPYNTFTWEGIDGSTVLAHMMNDYNSKTDPATLVERWTQRVQKDEIATRLVPFGFGDGGGGPTRDHLEYLRRTVDLEGVPKTVITSPIEFFKDQEARGIPEARYVGELYFQAHRGTYTSQARTKRGNRKSEFALREAELWGVAATALKGYSFPAATLDEAWKRVLLNQFHDIIPGSSIHRVYEEAEAIYADVLNTAGQATAAATATLTDESPALTVFNSLSWPRTMLVPLPGGWRGAQAEEGKPLSTQRVGADTFAEVKVPPMGWATVRAGEAEPKTRFLDGVIATANTLENEYLRAEFNAYGEIVHLYDKEARRELAAEPIASLKMYKDVPIHWDAWDLESMYPLTPLALEAEAQIEVLAAGPLMGQLRITRQINYSPLTQIVTLRRGSRRIDFACEIDWQESHKLLKVNFPVTYHANEALHEIQFGHVARPNHFSRPFDADRFEVSNHKWSALVEANRGFAVLNDCKYGVNVVGHSINLTLLKSPLAPDMTADKGKQVFSYACYAWNGPMVESNLLREAYDLNAPVTTANGAAGESSLLGVDASNVVIETVKPAEDGSGDVIVRLYEAMRTATRCTLRVALPVRAAEQTDMLERHAADLSVEDGGILLDFRPFEVKTVRLRRQ